VISLYTVHNELLRSHKQILPRLYRPFWFDRQGEYLSGEPRVISGPMFRYDGKLRARLSLYTIEAGQVLMNEALDEEGELAIEALKSVLANTALSFPFALERGQLQYVNNLELCHRRTGFEDYLPRAAEEAPAGAPLAARRGSGALPGVTGRRHQSSARASRITGSRG
jgi:hypothetical protein